MADHPHSYPPIPYPQPQLIQPYASQLIPPPVNGGLQMSYPNPNGSQPWVPEQTVASYSIPNVIQPLVENLLPFASLPTQTTNWSNSYLPNKSRKRKQKMSQSVRCEICDIYCNSLELYEKHLSGKKHLKALKNNYPPPSQPTPQQVVNNSTTEKLLTDCNVPCSSDKALEDNVAGHKDGDQEISVAMLSNNAMDEASSRSVDEGLDSKKQKLSESENVEESMLLCNTNNAICGSDVPSADHLDGEKHNLQVAATSTEIPSASPAEDLRTKKQKLIQSGVAARSVHVCTICNVVCNSEVVFADHILGKKHIAQVQKSSGVCNVNQPSLPTEINLPANLDSKRKKVEESGTCVTSMRVCYLCNVVCNSDSVFNSHLAGQKHASMLKKMTQTEVQAPAASIAQ
ncbi:hypothetical protein V2J09_020450 [Rumex salicifolius]